jgi:DNA-binding FrmR family transcriptional regulator
MSAPDEEKSKLLKRLNHIRGQVEAMRHALEGQASSAAVLQQATTCRGALNGFRRPKSGSEHLGATAWARSFASGRTQR